MMHLRGKKSRLNRVSGTVVGTTVWQTGAGVHVGANKKRPWGKSEDGIMECRTD